jgi:ComF family protein
VRAVRSVCWFPGGTAREIVHALKYGGWRRVGDALAERMARVEWPPDVLAERTAVIAVPLSRRRERERGYNQSAVIARALAARWCIADWSDVLTRTRSTASQTRLTPEARRRNVSGAFRIDPEAAGRLRGAHVVVVDDVVTTGATVAACASELFHGGARIVSVITFGRAPALGDRPADGSEQQT